jgi:hypothetical protein
MEGLNMVNGKRIEISAESKKRYGSERRNKILLDPGPEDPKYYSSGILSDYRKKVTMSSLYIFSQTNTIGWAQNRSERSNINIPLLLEIFQFCIIN